MIRIRVLLEWWDASCSQGWAEDVADEIKRKLEESFPMMVVQTYAEPNPPRDEWPSE